MKKILLIGCGHMGGALMKTWIDTKKYSISVIDPIVAKKLKSSNHKKLKIVSSQVDIKDFSKFDFIIFAIKPSDLNQVLKDFEHTKFKKNVIIVSVVAGKKIKIFENKLKNVNYVIRVMPNMPAIIGQSMNCFVANNLLKRSYIKDIKKLFSYSGRTIELKNEDEIDMATAVSGSGPGYVFNLIDAMEKAAIKLGFNQHIANILVTETFKGSIDLLLKNKISAQNLVKKVATKGGTTEAGLDVMKKNNLHLIFEKLIRSSYKKAKIQGKK